MSKSRDPPTRSYNFAFELYPESCGDDFNLIKQKLSSLLVPCLVSPLHSPDIEEKKPHYHVYLFFSSLKSYQQVLRLVQNLFGKVWVDIDGEYKQLNVVSTVLLLADKIGAIQYLVHLNNPEKQQFISTFDFPVWKNITCINFDDDISRYFKNVSYDSDLIILMQLIRSERFFTFSALVDYLVLNNDLRLFSVARKNSGFLKEYIIGCHYEAKSNRDNLKVVSGVPFTSVAYVDDKPITACQLADL